MPKKTEPKKRRSVSKPQINKEQQYTDSIEEIKKQIESVNTDITVDYDGLDEIVKEIDKTLEPINEINNEVQKIEEKKIELENLMKQDETTVNEYIEKELKDAETLKEKISKIMSSQNKQTSLQDKMTDLWNGCNSYF